MYHPQSFPGDGSVLYVLLFMATLFLAYSNGANDNFKGVATLFGSGATHYRRAIHWATLTTFAGSVCAIFVAGELVKNFSGRGLVPESIAGSTEFLVAVSFGAATTVLLATLTGFPISTTHALTGGLVGAGFVAVGAGVNFTQLGTAFFLPLLVSPLIALVLGAALYSLFHGLRLAAGITEEPCVCVDAVETASCPTNAQSVASTRTIQVTVDSAANCQRSYKGGLLGVACQPVTDGAHFISAGAVCFARGMNDTPKIVALMLVIPSISIPLGMIALATGMALGGLLNARKVAETMSKKITPMNHGQGFSANLVTAALVIFASKLGVPVSTTHVSVGSITGMGLITKKANLKIVGQIGLSWLLTLPIAAMLSATLYYFLS